MKQKTTYFILLLFLFPFLVLSQDLTKDTIYGNIKRIREKTCKDFIKTKRFVGYKIDK